MGIEDKALTESNDCYTITGYGSVFGNKDLGGDVVVEGAYAQSLRENGLPLFLFQHKTDDVPIGTVVEARENKRGLWIKAELPRDDQFVSSRLIPQLKRRGLRGLPVEYRALETEKRPSDGARLLKRIRVYEVSLVSMPMNPLANVETINSPRPISARRCRWRRPRRSGGL